MREGEYISAGTDDQPEIAYTKIFKDSRALFMGGEVKNAQGFRDLDWSFGILPFPKYDESQANYRSTALHQYAVFTIPVTNTEPEDAALAFDALSFESEENVIEPYFSVIIQITQKVIDCRRLHQLPKCGQPLEKCPETEAAAQ